MSSQATAGGYSFVDTTPNEEKDYKQRTRWT